MKFIKTILLALLPIAALFVYCTCINPPGYTDIVAAAQAEQSAEAKAPQEQAASTPKPEPAPKPFIKPAGTLYPLLKNVYKLDLVNNGLAGKCHAFRIHKHWLISAAHCFRGMGDKFFFWVGYNDTSFDIKKQQGDSVNTLAFLTIHEHGRQDLFAKGFAEIYLYGPEYEENTKDILTSAAVEVGGEIGHYMLNALDAEDSHYAKDFVLIKLPPQDEKDLENKNEEMQSFYNSMLEDFEIYAPNFNWSKNSKDLEDISLYETGFEVYSLYESHKQSRYIFYPQNIINYEDIETEMADFPIWLEGESEGGFRAAVFCMIINFLGF